MPIPLSLACSSYDRTEALRDGTVSVEGVDLTYITLPVEEIFFRMARFREFDASELSLSSYVVTMNDGSPFIAIPVFPSRMFRHSSIYVHTGSGVATPGDLVGKTVGIAEYQLTANVWIRGILAEHCGVPVSSVRYRTGGLNAPGRVEKLRVNVPDEVEIEPIPSENTLSDMLAAGEIDAIYSPRAPHSYATDSPHVRRLFSDAESEERAYYQKTGIFPIMHVIALRRDRYEKDRWLARSLTKAFEESRQRALPSLVDTTALKSMLPWLPLQAERARQVLGNDYWPYGLEKNLATIEKFLQYSYEQGLAERVFDPRDLFAEESLEDFVI